MNVIFNSFEYLVLATFMIFVMFNVTGLQSLIPAASVTGQHTCRTTAAVFSHSSQKHLHTICNRLVISQSVCVQQKRHVRKIYPDPLETDLEYGLL